MLARTTLRLYGVSRSGHVLGDRGGELLGVGFKVEPEHLAGYATCLDEINGGLDSAWEVVNAHCLPQGWEIGGILEEAGVIELMEDVTERAIAMLDDRRANPMGDDLRVAAWTYMYDDDAARGEFDPSNCEDLYNFPGETPYPLATSPSDVANKDPESDLPHPDEVRESASWITGLLSDLVATVDYEYSLDGMLDKLIGDWHILDSAGKAYLHTGEALRVCDEEGTDGLKRLMRHWDGGAAEAFDDYVGRYFHAIRDQGAAHRLLGEVYTKTAQAMHKIAELAVAKVDEAIQDLVGRGVLEFLLQLAKKLIPVVGQIDLVVKLKEIAEAIYMVLVKLKELIEALLQALKEGAMKMIKALDNPKRAKLKKMVNKTTALYNKLKEKSGDIVETAEFVGKVAKGAQYALKHGPDVKELYATPEGVPDAPEIDEGYSAGTSKKERARAK